VSQSHELHHRVALQSPRQVILPVSSKSAMGARCTSSAADQVAPTVILESGYRNDAEIWSTPLEPGMSTVFPQVAKFTRVCAYVRPGTFLDANHLSRSTRVPMPRTARDLGFRSSCLATSGACPRTVCPRRAFLWWHLCPLVRQHLPR